MSSSVKVSETEQLPEMLEAEFVILANDEFHRASERVKEEKGNLDSKRIYSLWDTWLKKAVEKLKLK